MQKVSIITPCLNQGEFLEETIRSVLAQDYPQIEYLILDGGSTDQSVEIIRKYADRLAYWHSAPDSGQAAAINLGFRRATGEIVTWLNSDDLLLPGAVSQVVKTFTETPALEFVYGRGVLLDKGGGFLRYFTEIEPYCPTRLRTYSDFILQPAAMYKRNLLERAGYLDESLHYTMDWDLWCKFARLGARTACLDQYLAAARIYSEAKTGSGGGKRLREILRLQLRHMSGCWPHGFFIFAGDEFYQAGISCPNRLKGLGYRLVAKCLRWLSPQSVLHFRRQKPSALAQSGVYPLGGSCQAAATIRLPYYKSALPTAVNCEVAYAFAPDAGPVTVTFCLGGQEPETVRLTPDHPRRRVSLAIEPRHRQAHEFAVHLQTARGGSPVDGLRLIAATVA